MAALRDVVRDYQEELRGGIAWVVFWREGTSWDGQSVYLDDDGLLTKDDRVALTEILQKDAHAVALNSYYSGQVTEDMTVDELTVGVRHHYRRGSNSLAVFFEEHKNLMQDLYDKISEEQSQYKDWLMKQPPNVILDYSYDYSIREEILASVEDGEHKLCDSQVNALLSVPHTLAYLRKEYERSDPMTMEHTWEIIQETADRTNQSLGRAETLIGRFRIEKYEDAGNFNDLSKVPLVSTVITEKKIPLQVNADLVNFRIERYVNGKYLDGKQFPGLEGMIQEALSHLDYDELTHVSEDELTSCGIYLDELDQAAVDQSQDYYEDGHFCPNVAAYQELKAEHPRKVAGVRVGEYMLFYGEDARTVAPALHSKLLDVDIPGMGKTQVAGSNLGWQYVLKKLVERNIPVVIAEPDTERGEETPYKVIKEREKVAGDGTGYDIPPECSSFTIYQLKLGQETDEYLFQPYEALQEKGLKVTPEHYEKVYMAPLSEEQNLEEIYMEFNVMKPDDYRGRSLSISDVVVIHEAREDTAYYCDLVGFREVPEFLGQEIKIQEREEEELEEL